MIMDFDYFSLVNAVIIKKMIKLYHVLSTYYIITMVLNKICIRYNMKEK